MGPIGHTGNALLDAVSASERDRLLAQARRVELRLPVYFGASATPNIRAIAHIPGVAICLPATCFAEEARGPGRLHDVMDAYTHAMFTLAAQEVACNRLHNLLERCSLELLMADDPAGGEDFPLTQELVAEMLAGLEGATCDCYTIIRDAFARAA